MPSAIQDDFISITTLAYSHLVDTSVVISLLHDHQIKVVQYTNGDFLLHMKREHGICGEENDKRFYIDKHPHFYWKRISEKVGRPVCGYNFLPNSFVGEYVDGEPPVIDCDKVGVLERDLPKIEKVLNAYKQHRQFEIPSQNLNVAIENPVVKSKEITKLFNEYVRREKPYTEKQVKVILRANHVLPPSPGTGKRRLLQAHADDIIRCAKAHK